jgi:hypothetical protein
LQALVKTTGTTKENHMPRILNLQRRGAEGTEGPGVVAEPSVSITSCESGSC